MACTIGPTDVLVATGDPAANAVLALANRLYWAADRCSRAEDQATAAPADDLTSRARIRWMERTKHDLVAAQREFRPLSDQYDMLMQRITDNTLYARIEATVWRDRRAEYAHARAVAEREEANRR